MIQALIIAGLLFFPSPISRDPSGAQEIAITQWGEARIGTAHNYMAGGSFYEADTVRVLIDNEWRYYEVVESGIYLCETPRPNCNDAVFLEMYEPGAVILATCWPRVGETRGQWIIKMLPIQTTQEGQQSGRSNASCKTLLRLALLSPVVPKLVTRPQVPYTS